MPETAVDSGVVKAIHLKGDNSDLIVSAARLGYIRKDDETLDATYGKGVFWKQWQPTYLVANDWDASKGYHHYDFRELPTSWQERFDVVVFDPDYKLQGTSSNNGPASSNTRYGMDRPYRPVRSTWELYADGMTECWRVLRPGGYFLVKTMDQVVSGAKKWLTDDITTFVRIRLGGSKVDEFMLEGMRAQPSNRTRKCPNCGAVPPLIDGCVRCDATGRVKTAQQHSATNYSTLLIFKKGRS